MGELLTVPEVAAILRVSHWTVQAMTRDGRLPRVPGLGRIRIPRAAIEELTGGVYDAPRGEPDREAPTEAATPRRGDRRAAQGPLAGEAVGGRG